ncbi:MAG: hypothetical protein R3D55_28095 [Chloroflexota bacterium]
MTQSNEASPTTDVLRAFGLTLLLLGLFLGAAWLFNWADAQAFANGVVVEGTIEQILEGESPGVQIRFVDANGRFQRAYLENITTDQLTTLSIGDSVVAMQMQDSPSRLRLAETVEAKRRDAGALIVALGLLLPGLFLLSRQRPFPPPDKK